MDKSRANHCVYEFGTFRMDTAQGVLHKGEETVALTPKAFETLLVLVKNGGRVVQKQELLSAVWTDTFVEESNLTFNISVLRKTLNEGAEPGEGTRYIETVPKRGYRFVASVREISDAAAMPNRHGNTIEISGSAESNDNGASAFSASTRLLNADDSHSARTSFAVEHDSEAAAILEGKVEYTGQHRESSAGAAMLATTAAERSRTRPRWLFAIVPVCLLLACVGAWQGWQQRNSTRQQASNDGSSFAPKPLSPQSEARALYLKGRLLWNTRSDKNLIKSEEFYKRALDLDSNYALAYSGLADVYAFDPYDSPRWREGENLARKAIALDGSLAEPHASLGFIQMFHHWDFAAAENEFKTAISINSDYATAHHWYAVLLECKERFPEAKAEIQRAQECDPLSLPINADVAEIYYFARDYTKARDYVHDALELDDGFAPAKALRGKISAQLGMFDSEDEASITASCADISTAVPRSIRDAYMGALCPQRLTKQASLVQSADANRSSFAQAQIYASLGDNEQALAWLEKAYESHSFFMPFVKITPSFDALHNDSRYLDILRRMRLDGN